MRKILCASLLFVFLLSACTTSGEDGLPDLAVVDHHLDYNEHLAKPDDTENNIVFEEVIKDGSEDGLKNSSEAVNENESKNLSENGSEDSPVITTSPDPYTATIDPLAISDPTATPNATLTSDSMIDYFTFEEALLTFATDVVIAQYVGSKPFGQSLTEYEFAVSERVLGHAADSIFVYAETDVITHEFISSQAYFMSEELAFNPTTNYMLPLIAIGQPHANTHDDGYTLIHNIIIDLDHPSKSVMYGESLAEHSANLDFNEQLSKQDLVSFVADLTQNNPPGRSFIRSESIEDIIDESPYILIVEINDPLRLSHEQVNTDWGATDLYHVTVVRSLKGDIDVGYEFVMIFLADTVLPGEQHIIATGPPAEGSSFYRFSSRNSLFQMEQLDEILSILD